MDEVAPGVLRLTLPLPMGPGHVHCYLLSAEGGWMLVDTGLGLPGVEDELAADLAELDGPVTQILITHFHPDHVGGAEPAARLTGAQVYQGARDYDQCVQVWGSEDWPQRIADWFVRNGLPRPEAEELVEADELVRPAIRFAPDPVRLQPGDAADAWEIIALPGHADGHLGFVRDGLLVAGDHLLPDITPAIGLYPDGAVDPLGDYLASLERTIRLAPRLALPGHGDPIDDPVARAREIVEHHRGRLDAAVDALGPRPSTGYDVSLVLFDADLSLTQRRFAVAETLAHLERLVASGRARRTETSGPIAYTEASLDDDPIPRRPLHGRRA